MTRSFRRMKFHLLCLSLLSFSTAALHAELSDAELAVVGRKVWKNECGGTRDGLTSWNAGENFASLGIGHFIWFPRGVDAPFEESFPKLVRVFKSNGVNLPEWLRPDVDCPWRTRAEFQAAFRSERMNELRALLASTVAVQSRFLAQRLEQALPMMTSRAPAAQRENVRRQFARMMASSAGTFAMIDYVNFKGEGTNPRERYRNEGWGLLQVLAGMSGSGPGATREFSQSAARVLTQRVRQSPPARREARWLPGWLSRVRAYAA